MMSDTVDLLQIKIENAKKQLSKETLAAIAAVPWQAEILKMRETKGYSFEQLEDLEIETELVLCGLVSPEDYPKELESRMKLSKAQVNELLNEMNKQVFSKIQEELRKITERVPPPPEGLSLGLGPKLRSEDGRGFLNSPLPNPSPKGRGDSPHPDPLLVKERGNTPDTEEEKKVNAQILNSAGIEIIPEKLELNSPFPERPSEENGISPSPLGRAREGLSTPSSKLATPAYQLAGRPQEGNILSQKLSGSVKNAIVKTDHSLANLTPSNATNANPDKPIIDPYREVPE